MIHVEGVFGHMWPGCGSTRLVSQGNTQLFPNHPLPHPRALLLLPLRSVKGCGSYCFRFGFRSVHFNIYLLTAQIHTCMCMYVHIFGFLFIKIRLSCVCVCILCKIHIQFASWTSVQISNIDYKYLLACQPEVHSALDMLECCCFYIKLQLCVCDFICVHTYIQAHTCQHGFHIL